MDQVELFDPLTQGKQMTDVKFNRLCYVGILGII